MSDHRMQRPRRNARTVILTLSLGLAAASLPGAAQAQFFGNWGGWDNGGPGDSMGPRQARRSIAEQGFRVLGPLRRNGNVFVADVIDPRGRHERLIVAASDAEILQRFYVDDGQDPGAVPRSGDGGRPGFAIRGPADGGGLVPPGSIPNVDRRLTTPAYGGGAPSQRYGDVGGGNEAQPSPVSPGRPPIRTVRPRTDSAGTMPDYGAPQREPGPVEVRPLAPAVPPTSARPATVVRSRPIPQTQPVAVSSPPATVASRPDDPVAPATQSRRLTDPLAIPGGARSPTGNPVRSVASGITGGPQATPAPQTAPVAPVAPGAPSTRPADVPVAPLD